MPAPKLAQEGFGLSWVYPEGADYIKKSLAPTFLFFDSEQFNGSNASHRLKKRGIAAYVSVAGPLRVLAYGSNLRHAVELASDADGASALERATKRAAQSIEIAAAAGADAIVVCDDFLEAGVVVAPLLVMDALMPCYRALVEAATAAGLPAIFSASGDIRDYYPALSEAGFAGVHVAHPEREGVAALFDAARASNLVPVGGIIGAEGSAVEINDAAQFACGLALAGPALICDDGHLDGVEQIGRAVTVLTATRDRVHAKLGK